MTEPALTAVDGAARHANDNVPGTITPDDVPFFLALALVCAATLALAAYVAFMRTDSVRLSLTETKLEITEADLRLTSATDDEQRRR